MTRYIIITMMLLHAFIHCPAQGSINTRVLIVYDSLSLAGKWIKKINDDSLLQQAGEKSISTDGAIKKYINKKIVTHVEPEALAVYCKFYTDDANPSLKDSIQFRITSSDGMITPVNLRYLTADWLYAYGKPPFRIESSFVNNNPGHMLQLNIYNMSEHYNQSTIYNIRERAGYFKDTLRLSEAGWRRGVMINAVYKNARNPSTGDTLVPINITLENLTTTQTLEVSGNSVPPGSTITYRELMYLSRTGPTETAAAANQIVLTENGEGFSVLDTFKVRFDIYQNGVLTQYNYPGPYELFSIPIDPACRDLRVKLRYQTP